MFKNYGTFLIAFLALQANLVNCQVTGISWLFRGTAQQNNTVLTFNMYDTLNLVCRGASEEVQYYLTYALTKGSSAPKLMTIDTSGAYYVLRIDNPGTLIFDDFNGIQSGYENFVVIGDMQSYYSTYGQYGYRFISVGTLHPADSGTYHCSACYNTGGDGYFATSGALTIQVNTKSGQALSSRTKVNNVLTYSAVIMGASKLFF